MRSIKLSQLLIFTRQFAAMTNSQLQLAYILENLAKETPHKKMREVIQLILDDILHGITGFIKKISSDLETELLFTKLKIK